ncbi:mitochondrial carrier [Periconia macrospinosa]|uniref:Mitochondrial carrier n=1 Tax=Periconia macrospinosa TaxID=97972 RepID=A0A2V1CZW5_9PLEO|nr:mitochondrial carrier [Periconia macrospinosa]
MSPCLPTSDIRRRKPDAYGATSYLENAMTRCSMDTIRCLAGASSGMAASIVTCPLDVIKIKLQGRNGLRLWTLDSISIRRSFQDRGLIGTGRVIWREGGLTAMYQGLGPTMLGYLPRWAIFFASYHRINDSLNSKFEGSRRTWISSSLSAVAAGACSTLFTNPFWVIKTRLISQSSISTENTGKPLWEYSSALDAALKIYRNEGVVAFYSGLSPALLGVTHLAIQFPLYELLKIYLTGAGLGRWKEQETFLQVLGILTSSSLSKMCASAATYPHEVIRTRLQTQKRAQNPISLEPTMSSSVPEQTPDGNHRRVARSCDTGRSRDTQTLPYGGVVSTFRTILREEGWRAFYAGMGTGMIRAVPASATTMLVYEVVVQMLTKAKKEGELKLELHGGIAKRDLIV